jgi:hypothetical protein
MNNAVRLEISLPEAMHAKLTWLCGRLGVSKRDAMRVAVQRLLDQGALGVQQDSPPQQSDGPAA